MVEKIHAALSMLPYMAGIEVVRDADVLSRITHMKVGAGEVLFREGDAADALYIVQRGEVEIVRIAGNLCDVLAYAGVGDSFGELGLLSGQARSASARAVVNSGVFRLDKEVCVELAKRVRVFDEHLAKAFATHHAKQRAYSAEKENRGKKLSLYAFEEEDEF